MAQVINTNIASLNAQRNLNNSQSLLNTSLQRLSSGLRINSAKDDAAGLAISERMTAQIRGLNQAVRNANDGISLAQTAEGALAEVTNNLQRIRELAIQSANATNSEDDRAALQKEVAQLKAEIDRVANQTSFNGTRLLDGSFADQAFQVGANQSQTITIAGVVNAQIASLGEWTSTPISASVTGVAAEGLDTPVPATGGTASFDPATLVGVDFSTEEVSFDVTLAGEAAQEITLNSTYADGDALATAINGQLTGATASFADGILTITNDTTGTGTGITINNFNADADDNGTDSSVTALPTITTVDGADETTFAALTGDDFTINGIDIEVAASSNAAERTSALVAAINAQTTTTGVTASLVDGNLQLRSASGDIVIGGTSSDLTALTGLTAGTTADGGIDGSTAYSATGTEQVGFADLDILTVEGANNAILAMDAALKSVNDARADLGAIQNRFSSVVANLQTTSENLSASRSRILDADFAAETASLTRAQILQQAGVAMLAQANALPNNVLSLLR